MIHFATGPGQSFSLPLSPPSPSVTSPSSTSTTVLDSPHPYLPPHYRRASQGPSAFRTPYSPAWDIDRDDKQNALIESLNRNATVVFWFQPGVQPLRLHQEIPTFPLFSFSVLTEIVEHLHLSDRTYLDWLNPRTGAWEQQQVSFVRRIESEQRLLYRVRRGLFEALRDEECPGLEAEIKLQEEEQSMRRDVPLSKTVRKRPADLPLSPPVGKHHRSVSMQSLASPYTTGSPPVSRGPTSPLPMNLGSPAFNVNSSLPNAGPASPHGAHPGTLPGAFVSPHRPPAAVDTPPSHPPGKNVDTSSHDASPSIASTNTASAPEPSAAPPPDPPVPQTPSSLTSALALPLAALPQPHGPGLLPRKWPNDFFVYEIAAGLRDMERLAGAEPALKQDEVFRRAFGLAYVKSTFCRHRALWRAAGVGAQREYEEMGRDPRACWGEFARHVEGRADGGRRARGRGRAKTGAGGGGEEGEAQAQERMMNVIGMPLPMIMASLPAQAGGTGTGAGASGAADTRGRLQHEEPVMGSLRPPEEQQQEHEIIQDAGRRGAINSL